MNRMLRRVFAGLTCSFAAALVAPACMQPGDERAQADLEVGKADVGDARFRVVGGLAAVRRAAPGELVLWASAPAIDIDVETGSGGEWSLVGQNLVADAELTSIDPGVSITRAEQPLPTRQRWRVMLPSGQSVRLRLAPPDADDRTPWRFALMSDVQRAIDRVQDIFGRMNEQPGLRFMLGAGDLTSQGTVEQLERYQKELESLHIPYYTTLGNHELGTTPPPWHDYFGRASFHFAYRGVRFSMIDSGSATIDPLVYDWLDDWLAAGRDGVHVVAMHIPPVDPIGVRNGSFASRNEAAKLLTRLSDGGVDLTLYGHIHSYYQFDNAGIPAYISGGGGAIPERFDKIGRHYLVVTVDPDRGIERVDTVKVE